MLQAYDQQSVSNQSPHLFPNFPLPAQTGNIIASAQTFPPASVVTEFLSVDWGTAGSLKTGAFNSLPKSRECSKLFTHVLLSYLKES